ncbi:hypothetical protein KBA41_02170 [Candidatus Ozemobacteraceae bacterium]|nr:hypothetical protein [Candidatus Ozemobacteraceae bacterium]
MNEYKRRREAFIRKHFPFPESLERAIRLSAPASFSTMLCGEDPLVKLHRIDRPQRITRLLETIGYYRHFNWSYTFNDIYAITDWCALSWKPGSGLWVHFESLNIHHVHDPRLDIGWNEEAREFLFSKRKIILTHFCGGLLVQHFREEDFSALLCK